MEDLWNRLEQYSNWSANINIIGMDMSLGHIHVIIIIEISFAYMVAKRLMMSMPMAMRGPPLRSVMVGN